MKLQEVRETFVQIENDLLHVQNIKHKVILSRKNKKKYNTVG